ncbi:hypothetical protein MAPG_03656 [Magnaporthiopsis poae ATCC 64411]|uniref:Secreted protein n=1 Tax=Magnaporthiopsis poae (strain ATCC 64411 / 73-15) TaxID=644358 RepID=A0A0C4DUL6_MAGP6|nr:hypothetical protein MAPG_03656 [Magnaporthiopsis poae ATCC 64411]
MKRRVSTRQISWLFLTFHLTMTAVLLSHCAEPGTQVKASANLLLRASCAQGLILRPARVFASGGVGSAFQCMTMPCRCRRWRRKRACHRSPSSRCLCFRQAHARVLRHGGINPE